MQLRVIGCGDAFGSGGRFQACFLVTPEAGAFLIDRGASSMTALRRFNVDPNEIGTVFVSHLHGDHFGGLPFLILDARLVSGRKRPLTLAGPRGSGKGCSTRWRSCFTSRRRHGVSLNWRSSSLPQASPRP